MIKDKGNIVLISNGIGLKNFKIIGNNAINYNKVKFYKILYFIGNNIEQKYKKKIKNAIKMITIHAKDIYNVDISSTEIKNLIREKNPRFRKSIYKISVNSNIILQSIFDLLNDIERKKGIKLSTKYNNFSLGRFCRLEIISDLDLKLDKIENPFFIKKDIETLKSEIKELRKEC